MSTNPGADNPADFRMSKYIQATFDFLDQIGLDPDDKTEATQDKLVVDKCNNNNNDKNPDCNINGTADTPGSGNSTSEKRKSQNILRNKHVGDTKGSTPSSASGSDIPVSPAEPVSPSGPRSPVLPSPPVSPSSFGSDQSTNVINRRQSPPPVGAKPKILRPKAPPPPTPPPVLPGMPKDFRISAFIKDTFNFLDLDQSTSNKHDTIVEEQTEADPTRDSKLGNSHRTSAGVIDTGNCTVEQLPKSELTAGACFDKNTRHDNVIGRVTELPAGSVSDVTHNRSSNIGSGQEGCLNCEVNTRNKTMQGKDSVSLASGDADSVCVVQNQEACHTACSADPADGISSVTDVSMRRSLDHTQLTTGEQNTITSLNTGPVTSEESKVDKTEGTVDERDKTVITAEKVEETINAAEKIEETVNAAKEIQDTVHTAEKIEETVLTSGKIEETAKPVEIKEETLSTAETVNKNVSSVEKTLIAENGKEEPLSSAEKSTETLSNENTVEVMSDKTVELPLSGKKNDENGPVQRKDKSVINDDDDSVFTDEKMNATGLAHSDSGIVVDQENGYHGDRNTKEDTNTDVTASHDTVRRRKQFKQKGSQKSVADSDESDDEDEDGGIYDKSYRQSRWVYIGSNPGSPIGVDISLEEPISPDLPSLSPRQPAGEKGEVRSPMDREHYLHNKSRDVSSHGSCYHERTESVSTTISECEFLQKYADFKPVRTVKRKSSVFKYTNNSFQDNIRIIELIKSGDEGFGFHIRGDSPVIVSTVEKDSLAEKEGLKVGDVIVFVNDQNVVRSTHTEVVQVIGAAHDYVRLEVVDCVDQLFPIPDDTPICSGYLSKQGGTIFKTWRRRWFELKQDNCLYYYKNDKESDPRGAIVLTNYTVTRAPEVGKSFAFKASKYNCRTYLFVADSEEEMNKWASSMTQVAEAAAKATSWMDVSSHNVGLAALAIRNPDCFGYLVKMGNRRKTWRKRYCVLKDACLYYYQDRSSSTAQGIAHFHGYKVEEGMPQGKKFAFSLKPPEESMRTFYFIAENERDRARWIMALRESIGRWVLAD